MGFYYAREKQKFDAEWERLSAWYQAEGMSAEAIEAIRLGKLLSSKSLRTLDNSISRRYLCGR